MGDNRQLLQEEELEFLLNETRPAGEPEPAAEQLPGDGEITMRGDLDKIELADIFQTLAMSRMEGQLRVRNVLEQHELFFRDGYVRSIPPKRTEIKRIGQRLLQAGILSMDQLRTALLIQKKKAHCHLGEILVDEGYVTQEDIDDVFHNQVQEDLFALFTWKNGSFEFYRGPCREPSLVARLEQTPRFEVNGVLLEVARRGDEWQRVIEAIGDLDEILERVPDVEPRTPLTGAHETAMASIDGRRNVRALADQTGLGLFAAGCAVRDLANGGLLRPVDMQTGLSVAEQQCDDGDLKIATVTYHMLRKRSDHFPIPIAVRLAKGLARCGDSRWAGRVLVAAGRQENDPIEALKVARLARKMSSRSSEALQFLHALLSSTGADPQELIDVTSDLADAFAQEGETDEALQAVRELEQLAPGSPVALNRKAKILARFGFVEEAIQALEELAGHFRAIGETERLIAIYEYILKLDSRRRDIGKALRSLRTSRVSARLRYVGIGALVLGLLGFAYLEYAASIRQAELESIREEALTAISTGDLRGARALIAGALAENPDTDIFESVSSRIQLAENELHDRQVAEREATVASFLSDGELALAAADLTRALDIYDGLAEYGKSAKEIDEIKRMRIAALAQRVDQLRQDLTAKLPPRPNLLQSHEDRSRLSEAARGDFLPVDRQLAATILDAQVYPRLEALLQKDAALALRTSAETVVRLFERCDQILAEHEVELARTRTAQRLTPLFEAARRYESEYDFGKALEAYRRLGREHPEDDELKVSFAERVVRYETIQRHVEALQRATREGDFATAKQQLRTLQSQFADIPFDTLLDLPVHIVSTPAGAIVSFNGTVVGVSPLLHRYKPGLTTRVRIELQGFRAEETEFRGDEISTVRSLLARQPSFEIDMRATTDTAPTIDASGRAYFVDRSGKITCLDTKSRTELWRATTKDLSGLLPRPVLVGNDAVAVASIDGVLRCFDRNTGNLLWSVAELPCEVAPVSLEDTIVLATTDRRIVGLNTTRGEFRFEVRLETNVAADLITAGERSVIAVTKAGEVTAYSPRRGLVQWQRNLGQRVFSTPCFAPSGALGSLGFVSIDGTLTVLDAGTGEPRWSRGGLLGVELPPATDGDWLFVVSDATLHRFAMRDGSSPSDAVDGPATYTAGGLISAPPRAFGGEVFLGREDGSVEVVDARRLTTKFLLRSTVASRAPVAPWPQGNGVIATFSDGQVHGFEAWPETPSTPRDPPANPAGR